MAKVAAQEVKAVHVDVVDSFRRVANPWLGGRDNYLTVILTIAA